MNRKKPNQKNRMKLSELHPGKYLGADDIDGDTTATMTRIAFETMKTNDGEEKEKPVLYFKGVQKGLVLNKTNATRIGSVHGDETDLWIGKQIVLCVESVDAFGKTQWAVRVKPVRPAPKPSAFPKATQETITHEDVTTVAPASDNDGMGF